VNEQTAFPDLMVFAIQRREFLSSFYPPVKFRHKFSYQLLSKYLWY